MYRDWNKSKKKTIKYESVAPHLQDNDREPSCVYVYDTTMSLQQFDFQFLVEMSESRLLVLHQLQL